LTLSNTVQNAIIGEGNSITGGLIGAATLLVVNALVVRIITAAAAWRPPWRGPPIISCARAG
jgi:hypothetical protein